MTYGTLRADAAAFLQRDDLTAQIPTFVRYATAQFNRVLRVPQMESRDTRGLVAEYSSLPSDFLEIISISRQDGAELRYIARPQFASYAALNMRPESHVYTIEDMQFRFLPAPSAGAPLNVTILYYERIADLTTDSSTNWLLSEAPDLYLLGTLMQARMFLHDDARLKAVVEPAYEKELARMRASRVAGTGVVSAVPTEIPVGHRVFDIMRGW